MIAVAYAGGLFSGVSGVSRSNGLMTARITLVATCASRAWIRGDRENCSIFFGGEHQDELAALWDEYGDP
jgi:hypothetical protein